MRSLVVDRAVRAPASAAARVEVWFARALGLGLPVGLVAAVIASVGRDNPDAVGGLGLITVVPPVLFATFAVLTMSFCYQVWRRAAAPILLVHVAAEAFMLHGVVGLLEQSPRFATAWLHVGFVNVYTQTGHGLTADARFFWPAFFTTVAYALGVTHHPSALPLLRFAPLVFNLAYLLPLFVILRALVPSRQARWMAAWLFVLANWIGQDYFAPQAFAEFLFLTVLAVVLTTLRANGATLPRLHRAAARLKVSWLQAPRDLADEVSESAWARAGLLLVVVAICFALAMEHQFTPIVLVLDLFALLLVGFLGPRALPWAYAAIVLVWISYAAEPYWIGHLSTLVGNGSVSATVSTGVVGRVRGSDAHQYVVWVRIAFALLVWVLAAAGSVRTVRSGRRLSTPALALAFAPFLALGTQSYGGEAVLRVYLYTLPFMVALGVAVFVSRGSAVTFRRLVAFVLVSAALAPVFYIARFGNESYEQVRPAEVAAVDWLYRVAPHGATLAAVNPDLPWRYTHYADYRYQSRLMSAVVNEDAQQLRTLLVANPLGTYVILTHGQLVAVDNVYGFHHWGRRIPAFLERNGFSLIYRNQDALIFQASDDTGRP